MVKKVFQGTFCFLEPKFAAAAMCRTIINGGGCARHVGLKYRVYGAAKKPPQPFFQSQQQLLQQQLLEQQQQQQQQQEEQEQQQQQPSHYSYVRFSLPLQQQDEIRTLAPQPELVAESPAATSCADDGNVRSTVCAICQVDTGNYNLNYGANTCLSCRAFFRRAVQKTRNPQFSCKSGGACAITEATRRACKSCRFDACLRAGMSPECVMKGAEVQQRFAKYIQRKKGVDKKATTMACLNDQAAAAPKARGAAGKVKKERRQRKRGGEGDKKRDLLKVAVKEILGGEGFQQEEQQQQQHPELLADLTSAYDLHQQQLRQEQQQQQQQQAAVPPALFSPQVPVPVPVAPARSPNSCVSYYSDDVMLCASYSSSDEEGGPFVRRGCRSASEVEGINMDDVDLVALFDLDFLPSRGVMGEAGAAPPSPSSSSPSGAMSNSGDSGSNNVADDLSTALFEGVIQDDLSSGDAPMDAVPQNHEEGAAKEPQKEEEEVLEVSEEEKTEPADAAEVMERVRHVRRSWSRACEENRPSGKIVADVLRALAADQTLPKAILDELKAAYGRVFRSFASQQQEFWRLQQPDQEVLLERNGALFVQYVFGRVLGASADVEGQLQWMLLLEDAPRVSQPALVRPVNMQDLQQAFVDAGSRDQYLGAASSLAAAAASGSSSPSVAGGFSCAGSVALVLLLSTEDGLEEALSVPSAEVEGMRRAALERADWAREAFGWAGAAELKESLSAALELERLSRSNLLMVDCERILSMPELRGVFAAAAAGCREEREEEEWVARHLVDFDLVFSRLSFGPEFVKECAMHSLGVPLSRHFIPQATRMTVERLRAVMMHHQEFRQLPLDERERAWEAGALLVGAAVMRAKLEGCQCGNEQVRKKQYSPVLLFSFQLTGL